jgi:3-deoxy-D-manno-octulosonate 8-phosphate phosphatase (KDO 8-P phosphatase)
MDAVEIENRLKAVKLVVLDVDGVLTDGRIPYGDYGDELKFYDVQDGMGIVLLKRAGIEAAVITSKNSKTNTRRAKELKITHLYQDAEDKLKVFSSLIRKLNLMPEETCCFGDDLVDIPLLRRAGFAVAVPNAVQEVKACSHYVTTRRGGRGAVREVVDKILKAQNKWTEVTQRYFS